MNRDIEKHKKPQIWLLIIIEVILIAVMVVAIVVFVHNHMSGLIIALKSGSEKGIEDYLHNTRMGTSVVLLFLMQVIQVISIMIPGAPIQIAASVALDLEIGFAICYLGFIFGNFFVFTVARLMGGTIKRFLPQEGAGKNKLAKGYFRLINAKNPVLIIIAANLLPLLPNGIIPYAASQMKMSVTQFVLAVAAGSFVPIFANCTVGSMILRGNYLVAVIIFVGLYAIAGVLVFNQKRIGEAWSKKRKKIDK